MKSIDIALKDMTRSFRSFFAVVFMFVVPLLVTGMFYFMFGNLASDGGFNLPKTQVIVANLDEGGPRFNVNPKNIPGGREANTMGELIVNILETDDITELVDLSFAPDAASARAAVDSQQAQVAIIIPPDFSHQFADEDGEAVIEFYQDPTLTIGPGIIRTIMNRFMDSMAGVKIAVNVFQDEASQDDLIYSGVVVQQYLDTSLALRENPEDDLLDVRAPSSEQSKAEESQNILLSIITPIMGGMMIFYAFFTGASTAQSILKEDEERTLPRLFTTPTSQATILSGKLLLIVAHLIFGIQWGEALPVALIAVGIILSASSFGVFINSFLKTTKQGGVLFGGVLTVTGMLGMISIFAIGSPSAAQMGDTVSLLVPQGWAVRGLMQALNAEPVSSVLVTALVLLAWSVTFFIVGVWRFNKRYA